jgi:hypothetical protein
MSAHRTWSYPDQHPQVPGPWEGEPDKAQWIDDVTGLDCLIVRNRMGALCGYVGVPPEHPWHGRGYNECLMQCGQDWCDHRPEGVLQVHGGITFAEGCDPREHSDTEPRICHIPEQGRPDDVWWFGFDCAHAGDFIPAFMDNPVWRVLKHDDDDYRNMAYVQRECGDLADQLAAVR